MAKVEDGRFISGSPHLARRLGTSIAAIVNAFAKDVINKEIVGVGYDIEGCEGFPVLILNDGTTITIAQDDEVNGPGVAIAHTPCVKGETRLCQVTP